MTDNASPFPFSSSKSYTYLSSERINQDYYNNTFTLK